MPVSPKYASYFESSLPDKGIYPDDRMIRSPVFLGFHTMRTSFVKPFPDVYKKIGTSFTDTPIEVKSLRGPSSDT